MAIKILFFESGAVRISGIDGSVKGDAVEIPTLQLKSGDTAQALLALASPVSVPSKLLEKAQGGTDDDRVFRKLGDVVDEEIAALRERLRNALRQELEIKIDASHSYFGVQQILNTAIQATLRLRIPSLEGGNITAILAARARASINAQIGTATVSATLVLAVDVAATMTAKFSWEAPSWPAFDIPFPQFDLPTLNFSGLAGLLPERLPSFALPTLPFAEKLSFKWSTRPSLQITVDGNGALTLQTYTGAPDGAGVLWFGDPASGGVQVAGLSGFGVKSSANQFLVVGLVTLQNTWTPEDRTIGDGLPFDISLKKISVAATLNAPISQPQADFTIAITVQEIRIQAKKDPNLFLVFYAGIKVNVRAQQVQTTIETLKVVEPYPIDLIINGVQALVGLLARLSVPVPTPSGGNPLPNIVPFLTRVADMLTAAAVWLVEQAGQAAQALASVAESAFALLKKAITAILQAGANAPVVIEVRLDPATYRLRQILISPKDFPAVAPSPIDALGLTIAPALHFKPCIVVDLGASPWVGLALVNEDASVPSVTLSTDLWLARSTSAAQPVKAIDQGSGQKDSSPLIKITATLRRNCALVLFSLQEGRIGLFQKSVYGSGADFGFVCVGETGSLQPLTDDDAVVTVDTQALQDRLTNLLSKPQKGSEPNHFLDALESHVKIVDAQAKTDLTKRRVTLTLTLKVVFREFEASTNATLTLSLIDLSARLEGADRISISLPNGFTEDLLGLSLAVEKSTSEKEETFYIDLSGGKEEFGLGKDAKASLTLKGLASNGGGLSFNIDTFRIGRDGLNLSAATKDDPVTLGGINMPFRFHSGKIEVVNSEVKSANLSGSGQLPPALIGEANVSINLRLKDDGGHVVVDSAEAKLDKGDNPIVCESTRFRFSLSKVEMAFEREGADGRGNYHFYFLLTGKARFQPRGGEFAAGLLKNLKELEIVLDRAPLTGDGRLLMQRISFQAKVDPPRKSRFFDLFEFELRGIGLHPSAPAFDGSPAVSISGQVKFTSFADKVQPTFRFHELWIAPPERGQVLPRIRFDGLTVGLDLGGMAEVEGTAIAVDGNLPTMFKPSTLPANVTANGFLASGRLSIKGWASMSAAMGFLELRKKGENESRLAFFFYVQLNKLSVPIPTPVGKIYLREVGFGFGWRYTLAGIAEAERVNNPKDLIRILDEVSKYQGSLDQIEAWTPTYESATLTLAMRAMFSVNSASQTSEYNEDKEKELPNPLLFDVTAAIRSDLTFLMSVRAWLCVNYADWLNKDFDGRTRPTLRGYLYLSVPKQTFLGRFLGDSSGLLGKHPELPEPLRKALEIVKFQYSSTLYITPGLFHFELGWPYELSVELGNRNGDFYIGCQGGYVFRVEDGAALYGYALRALGFAQIGVNTGGSFGAAVYARADFAIEGKLLSYLSLRAPGETMFYGAFRFDVHVSVSVRVWLEFSIFGGTIHWEFGFSFGITLALALEVAVLLNRGIGIRAYASIGIQAFGRSLSLGIELRLGGNVLDEARARVDRFLALGLAVSAPEPDTIGRPPALEPSRQERKNQGDTRIEESAKTVPAPVVLPSTTPPLPMSAGDSTDIKSADFWAMLFPTSYQGPADWYVMQLIPRDLTESDADQGSFFAPKYGTNSLSHKLNADQDFKALELNGSKVDVNPARADRRMSDRILDQGAKLDDIWQENFVVWSADGSRTNPQFYDPPAIRWAHERKELSADPEAAARALEMSGRQLASLPTEERRKRHIEERRSAMIVTVVNSALRVAQTGESGGWWKPDPSALLHCLDLGLTFLISADKLTTFFPDVSKDDSIPPKASFTIARIKNDKTTATDPGKIFLFNPPARMFHAMQPRLKSFSLQATSGGLALNWDLEPAWQASTSFWTDPEFHLRHYSITRRIVSEGLDQQWSCSFDVKAGAPRVYDDPEHPKPPAFHQPPLQFFDDLTQPPNLPQEVKNVITGYYASLQDVPPAYQHTYKVTYEIYAEDVAGTRDSGTVKNFTFVLPKTVVAGPRAVELQVAFDGFKKTFQNQKVGLSLDLNNLKLSVTYSTMPKFTNYGLVLSVVSGRPLPSGQYGADALSTALQAVTEASIKQGETFVLQQNPGSAAAFHVEFPQFDAATGQPLEPLPKDFYFASDALKDRFHALLEGQAQAGVKSTLRFFVRELDTASQLASDWHNCPVHLRVNVDESLVNGTTTPQPTKKRVAVDTVLEDYERPQDLAFESIQRHNFTEFEAGRMYFIEPKDDDAAKSHFKLVADRKRRSGVRLRWKARPNGLACNGLPAADNWRLLGGFHLFDATQENSAPVTVSLLPQSAEGLEPSDMGDMSLIEAAYPSNATRRAWKDNNYTGWFSLAESAPLFPEKTFRRSFMASVDEGLLSSLFEQGIPEFLDLTLRVTKPDGTFTDTPMGTDWLSPEDGYVPGFGWSTNLTPKGVRKFFRDACLKQEIPAGSKILITAVKKDKEGKQQNLVQKKEYIFEDSPHLHPLLADALDMLRYGDEDYRRYEIVFDPFPSRTIDDLAGWIDSTPVKSDPYGWGVLRTLGLAAGFRVYDTGEGAFLTGKPLGADGKVLHTLVHNSFENARQRYANLDIGAPFVDLFTAPLRNARAYSFDGSPDNITDGDVYQEQVAVIQISLRPRILALAKLDAPVGIRYFVIRVSQPTAADSEWTFTLSAGKSYTVDLYTLRTNVTTVHATLGPADTDRKQAKFTLGSLTKDDLIFAIRVVGADVKDSLTDVITIDAPQVFFPPIAVDLSKTPGTAEGLGVGEVLGLFPALTNQAWADQFFKRTKPAYLERFYAWTDRAGLTGQLKTEDYSTFAGKLVNWWKRFLDHGWGKAGESKIESKIRESLASIGKPGKWRVAEDTAGTVGVMLVEESEYGAMKRYIIRPFGRYEAFVHSVDPTPDAPPVLTKETVVDVTLPRTAPVTRPSILSAARIPVEVQDETGVVKERGEALELVVARTPDEIVSSANQTTAMGLASDGIAVGFWREFAYLTWGHRILGQDFKFDASLGNWDRLGSAPELTLTASGALAGVRSRVPDAWMGAWIYRMRALPYFYRVHALAHANAGVVVSEPTGTTFPEGVSNLAWFPETFHPLYRVWIDTGVWKIAFNLPLIAFRDCMISPTLWDTAGDFGTLVLLPDPAITYRVSLAAGAEVEANKEEILSADSQFEISPLGKPEDPNHQLYVVQSVGERMKEAPPELGVSPDANKRFQLLFEAKLKGPDLPGPPGKFTTKVPWTCTQDVTVSPGDFKVWKRFAPVGTVKIDYTKPATAGDQQALQQACDSLTALYLSYNDDDATAGIRGVLAQIRVLPASQTFTVPKWTAGLPKPSSPALVFNFMNDFAWNAEAPGTRAERRLIEKYISRDYQADLRADLRQHYLSGKALYLRQAMSKDEFGDGKSRSPICAPYQILGVQKRSNGFAPDKWEALLDELEASPFGAETIAALAVVEDALDQLAVIPSRLALGAPEILPNLEDLFTLDAESQGYFAAWLKPPGSKDLDELGNDSAFRRKAVAMAEEAWFGVHRKPRLSAVRGTEQPIHKEIKKA
jgi:hypothetical protein